MLIFGDASWTVPCGAWPVGVDLDAVAFGIGQVDRLADEVIRRPIDADSVLLRMAEPRPEVARLGQKKGQVVEAGAIVCCHGGRRLVPKREQDAPARAEVQPMLVTTEGNETDRVPVEVGHRIEVAHGENDAPDIVRTPLQNVRVGTSGWRSSGAIGFELVHGPVLLSCSMRVPLRTAMRGSPDRWREWRLLQKRPLSGRVCRRWKGRPIAAAMMLVRANAGLPPCTVLWRYCCSNAPAIDRCSVSPISGT